jgi:hypothetical protein
MARRQEAGLPTGGPAGTEATSSPMFVRAADADPLVLIPIFNDWEVVAELIPRLDAALATRGFTVRLLLVDDGSTDSRPDYLVDDPLAAIREVAILRLRRNLGHQRALAIGICPHSRARALPSPHRDGWRWRGPARGRAAAARGDGDQRAAEVLGWTAGLHRFHPSIVD